MESSPCTAHKGWSRVRGAYMDFLKTTTLSELAENQALKVRRKSGPNDRAERSAAGGVR